MGVGGNLFEAEFAGAERERRQCVDVRARDELVPVVFGQIQEEMRLDVIKTVIQPAQADRVMDHEAASLGMVVHYLKYVGLIENVFAGSVVDDDVELSPQRDRIIEIAPVFRVIAAIVDREIIGAIEYPFVYRAGFFEADPLWRLPARRRQIVFKRCDVVSGYRRNLG